MPELLVRPSATVASTAEVAAGGHHLATRHETWLFRGAMAIAAQPQEALNRAYYDAAGSPKALWEVSGAGHTAALSTRRQEYERRVVGFFDRALLGGRTESE
jgi:hypothetical protein